MSRHQVDRNATLPGMRKIIEGDGDPRHGTSSAYTNHGCRCADCRAVHATAMAEYRRNRMATPLPPDDHRHGTDTAYTNNGCRCADCRAAHSQVAAEQRRNRLARKGEG